MSLATGTIYRITFKSKRHNLQQQRRPYTVVICKNKSYITFVTDSLLMMAQSRAESTRDTYNYGQYLNQFPPNTIKVIREFERIQKRICRHKMSIMFNEICIYIYIYIYKLLSLNLFVCSPENPMLKQNRKRILAHSKTILSAVCPYVHW